MKFTDIKTNLKPLLWLTQSTSDLARHEGFREYAYPDPLSKLFKRHPGEKWGFMPAEIILAKLGENPNEGMPWTVGFGFTRGVTFKTRMPLETAKHRLEDEIIEHARILDRLIPSWNVMPLFAQTVLINLAFNLGYDKLKKFVNTLAAFKDHDWQEAAAGLRRSLWFKQVKRRAVELVTRLEKQEIDPAHKVV